MAIIHKKVFNPPPLPCIFFLLFLSLISLHHPFSLCIIPLASSFLPLQHPPSPSIISSPPLASWPFFPLHHSLPIASPPPLKIFPQLYHNFPFYNSAPLAISSSSPCIIILSLASLSPPSPCIICQLEELVLESQV